MDLSLGEVPVCVGAICQNRIGIMQSPTPLFSGELYFYDTQGDSAPLWDSIFDGTQGRWYLLYISDGEEVDFSLAQRVVAV